MQIQFDTGNETELAAVAALIAVLRGDDQLHADVAQAVGAHNQRRADESTYTVNNAGEIAGYKLGGGGEVHSEVVQIAVPEPAADPAEAFADGASAEQAFGGNAPTLVAGGTVSSSAPVSTLESTAPTSNSGQTATPAASPSSGVEVDKHGLPHDGRIHSSPPKKNADGSWRQKRGVDAATVETVTAQLRQTMAAPAAPAATDLGGFHAAIDAARQHLGTAAVPLPPTDGATISAPADTAPAAPVAAPVSEVPAPPVTAAHPATYDSGMTLAGTPAPTPPAPPVAPAAPAAPTAGVTTFADLMRKITGLQAANKLTVEGTSQIAQQLGIAGVRELMHRPDLVPAFDMLLPAAE